MAGSQTQGISGLSVAVVTAGAILAYSGFRGSSPRDVLRSLSTGSAPSVSRSASYDTSNSTVGIPGVTNAGSTTSGSTGVKVLSALGQYQGDKYSQAKRAQPGFSDCSSWIGKGIKDVGVKLPISLPVAAFYMVWTGLVTIPKSQIQAGDILVSPTHIAIATSSTSAVGQQNPTDNVKASSISNIMYGTTWIARRFKTDTGGTVSA
jgi:hypothetical protein